MSVTAHSILFTLSVAALAAAALRLASLAAPSGLERLVAAAPLAAAAAVIESLLLGLAGLGTEPLALGGAALATYAGGRIALSEPALRPGPELAAWLGRTGRWPRLWAGAALGVGVVWTAWMLRHPSIGFDSSIYHFTEVGAWVRSGHPGAITPFNYDLPFGNYPVTNEVLLTWGAGISRGWVPLSLSSSALVALLWGAGWLGLRAVRVPGWVAALGLAAVLATPWLYKEIAEPLTDLPALAWTVTAAALCACAPRRPALLAPASVAAGLAVGTKTTPIVLLAVVLAAGLYACRGRLRPLAGPLAAGVVVAVAVGGLWYVRNLVDHGSPLWPFTATPWGDPVPHYFDLVGMRFIERPRATFDYGRDIYLQFLAGGVALLAGGLLAPLLAPRRRAVLGASAATLLGLATWVAAPVTGLPSEQVRYLAVVTISTSRYLLPVIAAGTLALALTASRRGRRALVAPTVFAGALGWSLWRDQQLGLPYRPRAWMLLAGAVAGAATLAAIAWALPRARLPALTAGPAGRAIACAAVGLALALAATGYVERHGRVEGGTGSGRAVVRWMTAQPEYARHPSQAVAIAGRTMVAALAGDRFQHPVVLIPRTEGCRAVERRRREGWLLIAAPGPARPVLGDSDFAASRCLRNVRPAYDDGVFRIYRPLPARSPA